MRSDHSTHIADDWYLVANRNNLTIKIVKYITLGENEAGLLVLDSRVDAERWLTLEVDPGGSLNVVYQDPRVRLEAPDRWVADSAGAVLPRCTMLELPNNKVYVSQQLQRGKVEQLVQVTHGNPTETELVISVPVATLEDQEWLDGELDDANLPDIGPAVEPNATAAEGSEWFEDPSEIDAATDTPDTEQVALKEAMDEVVLAPDVLNEMLSRLERDGELSVAPEELKVLQFRTGNAASESADEQLPDPDTHETPAHSISSEIIVREPDEQAEELPPTLQDISTVYHLDGSESASVRRPGFELVGNSQALQQESEEIDADRYPLEPTVSDDAVEEVEALVSETVIPGTGSSLDDAELDELDGSELRSNSEEQTQPALPDDAMVVPIVESVYARPGRAKSGRRMLAAVVIACALAAGAFVAVEHLGLTGLQDVSPFKN